MGLRSELKRKQRESEQNKIQQLEAQQNQIAQQGSSQIQRLFGLQILCCADQIDELISCSSPETWNGRFGKT